MVDSIVRSDQRKGRQTKILVTLMLAFILIIFSPGIRLGLGELLPRKPVRLGVVEVSIPKEWMMSRTATMVSAWKPCQSILCGSSVRASFSIELSKIAADSEEAWRHAAIKVISRNYSGDIITKTIPGNDGTITCLELEPANQKGKSVASCQNPGLGVESTFFGDDSFVSGFYRILVSAQKVN